MKILYNYILPYRGDKMKYSNTKYNFDEVKSYFENQGCVLIETEYITNTTKMNFKCKCGNLYQKTFSNFRICPMCKNCGLKEAVRKKTNGENRRCITCSTPLNTNTMRTKTGNVCRICYDKKQVPKKCRKCCVELYDENIASNGQRGCICKTCQNEIDRIYHNQAYKKNSSMLKKRVKNYRDVLKKEVFTHYSPDVKCKCGQNDIRALSIDHINGKGCQHRKELGINAGTEFYRWLKKNHYPEGYQVLCMSCQMIKRIENNEF